MKGTRVPAGTAAGVTPIISIVGKSDSGKTTLIEKLVPELTRRGYVVGTIKHDAHKFDIDHPGKDSWRHKQAGAAVTVISSPEKAAIVKNVDRELTLDEIAVAYMTDVDIVLTEGFKRESKPKIEVLANGDSELISPVNEVFLAAGSTAVDVGRPKVGRDDISAVADAIESQFPKIRADAPGVLLVVDGKPIALNGIMKAMVSNTIGGLVSSLKGVNNPDKVEVKLWGRRDRG